MTYDKFASEYDIDFCLKSHGEQLEQNLKVYLM